jgi:hypothetical protein
MKSFASFSTGVAFRPPSGRCAACRPARSDLRVTGSAASALRVRTFAGSTSFRIRAKPGARRFACATCFGSAAMSAASRALGERVSSRS